jgi:hypothetical protein
VVHVNNSGGVHIRSASVAVVGKGVWDADSLRNSVEERRKGRLPKGRADGFMRTLLTQWRRRGQRKFVSSSKTVVNRRPDERADVFQLCSRTEQPQRGCLTGKMPVLLVLRHSRNQFALTFEEELTKKVCKTKRKFTPPQKKQGHYKSFSIHIL